MTEKPPDDEAPFTPAGPVLPYRDWQAEPPTRRSFGWNVAAGCALGVCFGLPFVFVSGIAGINAGWHKGNSGVGCSAIAGVLSLGPLLLLSRHLDRGGRRGLLAGAAITAGISVLAAGACYVGNA
jgi:hypothetical protein